MIRRPVAKPPVAKPPVIKRSVIKARGQRWRELAKSLSLSAVWRRLISYRGNMPNSGRAG